MIAADLPPNETQRLAELHGLDILDTLPEQAYDDITLLAAQICGTPIALVSLVDADRQWFKSSHGLAASETPRDLAFCAHAILEPGSVLVVPDTEVDVRFADNPLVTDDPSIRFYAGAPLVSGSGAALGTLCVIDREPRSLAPEQERALAALSRQVMAQLDLRRLIADLEVVSAERREYQHRLEEYQRRLESDLASASEQAMTDALTGLRNRRAFQDRLEEELIRHRRYGAPVSLALIDIDDFKGYNDRHGHVAGDEALIAVSELIVKHSRATDLVARYGGEEFAVLLPNTDAEGAYVLAQRFRRAVEQQTRSSRSLTISLGVATATGTPTSVGLLQAADECLYRAKEQGRNRVVGAPAP